MNYKVVINHGLNPNEEIFCMTETEVLQKYFQCCFAYGYENVRIEKVYAV